LATVAHLDFEKAISEVEEQIEKLQHLARERGLDVSAELRSLERKLHSLKRDVYQNLTPIERVQVARHPRRPYTLDYLRLIFTDFVELHGDRLYRDDESIVCGWARLEGESVMVIGHQKGRDMKENLRRNFGMPHPEGYRKALRLMQIAAKFGRPIVTLIDTPGAYPGLGAEERGQAEAIARNLRSMSLLRVPTIAIVIGEGGSGGALAIGVADRVLMLENSVYSVISPEGCAAILWKSGSEREKAAAALKLTAIDLNRLGIADEVIPEPAGGAHSDWDRTAADLKTALVKHLDELRAISTDDLVERRGTKYLAIGEWRTDG
jgi:acetyl-CoA carboxylase carboxyl transferase subunit alpha